MDFNNTSIESSLFKRVLNRNLFLPLVFSLVLCSGFISMILYLISVSREVEKSDLVLAHTQELMKNVIDCETGLRGYITTHDRTYLAPYIEGKQKYPESLSTLRAQVLEDPELLVRVENIDKNFGIWSALAERTISTIANLGSKVDFAKNVNDLRERKPIMLEMRRIAEEVVAHQQIRRDEKSQHSRKVTFWVVVSAIILSLGLGIFLGFSGRKQVLNLSSLYQSVLNKQTEQNEELSRRNWVKTGLNQLVEKTQGDLSLRDFSEKSLNFIVNYSGAQVGTFFILNSANELECLACVGLDGQIKQEKKWKLGEGLLGKSAQDQKIIFLPHIPQDHVTLETSLISTPPREIMIVPMVGEGRTSSVIELGFWNPPEARVAEFLKLIAPNISAGIRSANYLVRLQELLHESQQMTEELQTQQEELRSSNEQLAEQAKVLQDAQVRLESQHAELEQTNEQLEEQTQALENQNQALAKAQADLMRKAEELEVANQYKSEFLANMSHELRTPLNSSLILAKLLMDNAQGNLNAEQVEFASTIYNSGNDLLNLINDILDLSKVEAGKIEIQSEEISFSELANNIEKTFGHVAQQKGLRFEIKLDSTLPQVFVSDRLRVEQVIKNLISNAIKFTEKGSVVLDIVSRSDGKVEFNVVDTGIGIDASQLNVIFEAFRQGDGNINRKYGGTGLGLTISKNLAQLLGGSLEVKSEARKGSHFTFSLPYKYASLGESYPIAHQKEAESSYDSQALTRAPSNAIAANSRSLPTVKDDRSTLEQENRKALLIVEDDPSFAKILVDLSHELGFSCLVTQSTDEAFGLATRFNPSGIILDMKLPDSLGLSLLDRLKQNLSTRHIPVHVISAVDYSREALSLGAIGFILKPAAREKIKEAVLKLEDKINQKIKKVLVIEDDDIQRESIKRLISTKDVEIDTEALGENALTKLEKVRYDCIIVDLTLPDMSGFELLERMSRIENISVPPVIIYTGRSLTRAEEEKLRLYSKAIVIKGAKSPERLLDEVTLFMHSVESQLPVDKKRLLVGARTKEKAFEGRKILLTDDDVRNIFALTAALEQKGAKVRIARTGKEALKKLGEEKDIDLVLMDIMMPEMDGYEAMRQIRQMSEFQKLPVIAVTAKAFKQDYEKCLEAGANDYLSKPVDLDKLISLMRVWLPRGGIAVREHESRNS